jgi:hypothetical protein
MGESGRMHTTMRSLRGAWHIGTIQAERAGLSAQQVTSRDLVSDTARV